MLNNSSLTQYGRQKYILKRIRTIWVVILSMIILFVSVVLIMRLRNNTRNERQELLLVWENEDYEGAYEISKAALFEKPVDYFLLTVHGFSAYQLGISQINNQNMLKFINESIFSLRKALLQKESSKDGRVYYVLGKAYGYKGAEYADLAVKYLNIAGDLSYEAVDIPEYLGLAYAAYGDYRSSVEAFASAFTPDSRPSDNLLLSIARSYMAMEEYNTAYSYLQRCVDISPDSKSIVVSRMLLAEIYSINGDYNNAEKQYIRILNETGENAEVRFQLGELYSMNGDTTRARAEWRTAYRLDPSHAKARARLNI